MTRAPTTSLQAALELHRSGRLAEAESAYRAILAASPDDHAATHYLGLAVSQAGRSTEAIELLTRAAALAPGVAAYNMNLGEALRTAGRIAEAAACYRRAIAIRPDYGLAHRQLAMVFATTGRFGEAAQAFEHAMRLAPDLAGMREMAAAAYNSWGADLANTDRLDEAMGCFRRAADLDPASALSYSNMGGVLHAWGRPLEAASLHRRAIELDPTSAEVHNNLGISLADAGDLDGGIAAFGRAVELSPAYQQPWDNLLLAVQYHEGYDAAAVFDLHKRWGEVFVAGVGPVVGGHNNTREPARRIRVGYLSPDFRRHAVAYFIEPVLAAHDRAAVEVYCYADVPQPDEFTVRMRAGADVWRETAGVEDERVARMIREDRIDILVDLAGHTRRSRMGVLARRPAPVQVNWLGYPNTTGLAAVGYWVTDHHLDPVGETDRYAVERLVRLPEVFVVYRPPVEEAPEVNALPAIGNGYVTFGSFNGVAKLRPAVLEAWGRILARVPGARLVAGFPGMGEEAVLADVRRRMGRAGIDMARVELRVARSMADHLAACRDVDVCLDTFPFTGHTTTMHGLWMGLPTVSMAGGTHISRRGVTIMENLGLGDWVGRSMEEYEGIAVRVAGDIVKLAELRAGLRERMEKSALMDARRFVGHLERAYRGMWEEWCRKG